MEELFRLCKEAKRVYIYGAGRNAAYIADFLGSKQISIEGYIVTRAEDNPTVVGGKPVVGIDSWKEEDKDLIVSSMMPGTVGYRDCFNLLEAEQINNVFFFSKQEITRLWGWEEPIDIQMIREKISAGPYKYEENITSEAHHFIFSQDIGDKRLYRWRISKRYLDTMGEKHLIDYFKEKTALQEYESIYGKYHPIEEVGECDEKEGNSVMVYMALGKKDAWASFILNEPWIQPIQVGATFDNVKVFSVSDDLGDNISLRNRNYSEGTAIYWMLKNAQISDYIGLCHYRRRLSLSEDMIKSLRPAGVDIVVTAPTFVTDGNELFLKSITPGADFKVMRDMVNNCCPEYTKALETFYSARFYPPCNLFLMRWEVFKEYGEFAFKICFAVEDHYNELQYRRQDRYMGYLLEALLGIFLIKHKEELNIAYTDMQFIKSE